MEGVVLRSIPFEDHARVITVFTRESGVLSVMMKEMGKKNLSFLNSTSVMTVSDFQLVRGRSELYHLKDASLIDDFQDIRKDLTKLTASGKILKALLQTQLPEKPAPHLYLLLRHFLEKMKSAKSPDNLYLSFYLKLLCHEGLFPAERSLSPISFSPEEWQVITQFCHCRSFDELSRLTPMKDLENKLPLLMR